jgi:hypothetical protein
MTRYGTGRVFDRVRNAVALLVVILTLLVLLSTAAFAQDSTSAPVTSSEWGKYVAVGVVPDGMLAVTVCDETSGTPVVHFRRDEGVNTEEELADVMVHEMVHVNQLSADTTISCVEAFARITSTRNALIAAEAQATCAQASYLVGVNKPGLPLIKRWVEKFSAYLNSSDDESYHASDETLWRAIRGNCPLLTSSIYFTE